jgi:putative membrane protein
VLSAVVAHGGALRGPHDLWSAWSVEPLVVVGLAVAVCLHARGVTRRPVSSRGRTAAFHGGVLVTAVALLSPLDAASGALAAAHMVQHVLLVLVAAPLLAWSRPIAAVLAGAPAPLRHRLVAVRRHLDGAPGSSVWPLAAWLVHTAVLWVWHAAGPYEAAVRNDAVHAVEHGSFLGSALLFWWVVVGTRGRARLPRGNAALLTFAMALQSVFLAALLTFATVPWYPVYGDTTAWWGLEPLADQQLAGAIMWVPAGFVYVGVGILLVVSWLREGHPRGAPGIDDWGFAPGPEAPRVTTPGRSR